MFNYVIPWHSVISSFEDNLTGDYITTFKYINRHGNLQQTKVNLSLHQLELWKCDGVLKVKFKVSDSCSISTKE